MSAVIDRPQASDGASPGPRGGSGRGAGARGLRIQLEQVSQRFGDRLVLDRIQLDIEPGEFVAIVGRSGCGKSTLLRLIAGLAGADSSAEAVTTGRLALDGQVSEGLHEGVCLMFQEPRLLPWRRVLDNVALGLDAARRPAATRVLADVGLADRAAEWPSRLSGGQRQRVALARALVRSPRLLLLDEPLGALDALTRIEMHGLIESLWREQGFTAVLVTHDVQEAVALADRVLLIEGGRIAFDQRIDLPRPRPRGDAAFARLEAQILGQVMHQD